MDNIAIIWQLIDYTIKKETIIVPLQLEMADSKTSSTASHVV